MCRHIFENGAFYTQSYYRTLIGNHSKLSIGKLAIQLTTPLLLRKPCKLFVSVARVCQRQLSFLVMLYNTVILTYITYCNIAWACNSYSQLAPLIKSQK